MKFKLDENLGRGGANVSQIEELAATLAEALIRSSLEGKLWIVEVGRIREYTPEEA